MEINPQTVNPESPNSSNEHIFRYTLTWTPDQYRRGNIRIVDCNDDTLNSGWTTTGSTTISFTANGRHHYLFQEERWFYHNFNGWGWWGSTHPGRLLQVFIDDINQNHPQNVLGSYNGLPNDFELRDNGSTCPNNFASLSIRNVNWNDCNVSCFYDGDATELNIIQGSEYVELIDIPTETILGSFVQLSDYAGINNIGLQRKDDAPGVQTVQTIKVEANINDVKDTLEIEYFPDTFILNAEVYPETLTTGETRYIDISYYNECGPLPPETKINLEIINGIEFGNLIDPYTNEKVKTITNLDHWWGYAWVEYIADGKPKDGTDTITIRISTTDPDIIPKEVNIYIKPPPIFVYTNPDVVGAADTAEVIIKKRNPDGTLEDFPAEQSFELAVLDGCINGNILVGDSLGVYFSDAQLPIYFVAADSVSGDSGIVRLRVGTGLGGSALKPLTKEYDKNEKFTDEQIRIAELKADYKKMIEEKKAAVIESKNAIKGELPTEAPILEVCYYGSYLYETGYWEGDVVVGNECGVGAPPCNTIPQAPLGFKEEVVEWTGTYIFNKEGYHPKPLEKSSGGVTRFLRDGDFKIVPMDKENKTSNEVYLSGSFYSPYEIETCFNKNLNNGKGAYQYSFNSIGETDNFIHKPIIIQVADYTDDQYAMKSVNDLGTIPFDSTCRALKDFEYERYRKAEQDNDDFFNTHEPLYRIIESYWEHEKYHKRDGMRFMNDKYNKELLRIAKPDGYFISKTLKKHLETTFSCSQQIKNFGDAKREGEKYIEDALRMFNNYFTKNWHVILIDIYQGEQWKQYILEELWAHWSDSVQNKISRYQTLLASRQGYDPAPCEVELNKIRKFWDPFNIYRNNR